MSAPIDDGGPAFPFLRENDNPNMPLIMACSGMSLRDWFAGQAFTAAARKIGGGVEHADIIAADCYRYADAMLAARKENK